LEVARGGAGLKPGNKAEALGASLAGQLVFALCQAADGKAFPGVQMILPPKFNGKNHLAFARKYRVHKVRLRLTFTQSRQPLQDDGGDRAYG
jgi:hypothetical protein